MENIEEHVRDGVDLSNGDFRKANLAHHRLRRAKFAKCDFTEADLVEADLFGADLKQALLIGADLMSADMAGADLTGADLTGANLDGTEIETANLTDCIGIIDAGTDARGYRFVGVKQDDGWVIKAGCRWFSIGEAEQHWEDSGNSDALARVAQIVEAASKLARR